MWLAVQSEDLTIHVVVVQLLSLVPLFATKWAAASKVSCLSFPGACSSSLTRWCCCWWCCPTISSSVALFASCIWSFPASRSFLMSHFSLGGQTIGASASTLVLPMNIQDWLLFFVLFCFLFFVFICSGFCHTLKWNSHGFTCVPHPDPPSHFPLHPLPLGLPSAPCPSACLMHPTWAGDLFHPR